MGHLTLFLKLTPSQSAKASLFALTLLVCCSTAGALTLVEVTGPVTTGGQVANAHQATAVWFTLNQTFANVRISASNLLVFSATGTLVVSRAIGPAANAGDIVATKAITNTGTLFIDALTLTPGTYFFLIAVDAGTVGWPGSFSPTITTNAGSTRVFDLFASATGASALTANYAATSGIGALLYSVTGDQPIYTVTTAADELDTPAGANLSLREAMRDAVDGGTIQFASALAGQSIVLDSAKGELVCDKNLAIDTGNAAIAIDGGAGANRVFNIGAGKTLSLTGLTLTGGNGGGSHGGAIYSAGRLNVTRCTFHGNAITGFYGGAIYNAAGATLNVTSSTFSQNSARYGGAIENYGAMTLDHVTISGNSATNASGGLDADGIGTSNIGNTIIAGNTAPSRADVGYFGGTITIAAPNLIGSNQSAETFFPTGALVGTSSSPLDAKLAPPGNYGGPTQTMALKPGSPARNAGTILTPPVTADQRGFPIVATPDIGAYEAGTFTDCNAWIWETLPASATAAQHAATFDFDGDGATNQNEWIALTDPGNPASVLRITQTTLASPNISVTFPTVLTRHYTVEYSTDLASWTPVGGATYAGTGAPITSTLGPITGFTRFFLRVSVGP